MDSRLLDSLSDTSKTKPSLLRETLVFWGKMSGHCSEINKIKNKENNEIMECISNGKEINTSFSVLSLKRYLSAEVPRTRVRRLLKAEFAEMASSKNSLAFAMSSVVPYSLAAFSPFKISMTTLYLSCRSFEVNFFSTKKAFFRTANLGWGYSVVLNGSC
jgi:hypothetical protein